MGRDYGVNGWAKRKRKKRQQDFLTELRSVFVLYPCESTIFVSLSPQPDSSSPSAFFIPPFFVLLPVSFPSHCAIGRLLAWALVSCCRSFEGSCNRWRQTRFSACSSFLVHCCCCYSASSSASPPPLPQYRLWSLDGPLLGARRLLLLSFEETAASAVNKKKGWANEHKNRQKNASRYSRIKWKGEKVREIPPVSQLRFDSSLFHDPVGCGTTNSKRKQDNANGTCAIGVSSTRSSLLSSHQSTTKLVFFAQTKRAKNYSAQELGNKNEADGRYGGQ